MAIADSKKPPHRKKRGKLPIILLSPILAIVFIIGWIFYCIGQANQPNAKQPQKPINKTPADQNEIELTVIPQQQITVD
jgi:hypothetical protein